MTADQAARVTAAQDPPLVEELAESDGTGRALVVSGTLLGIATLVANAGNYLINLLLARWLTPGQFADATLMVTLWLTMSGVAMALVLVTGRFVGIDPDSAATARLLRRLRRLAWLGGLGLFVVTAGGAPLWHHVFHTASPWPFVVLAAGLPFHLSLAVGRGTLQGRLDFGWLSGSLLTEMAVRAAVSTTAVLLGGGVVGATAGLSSSLILSWAVVRFRTANRTVGAVAPLPAEVRRYIRLVAVLLVAQVVLSNVDVLAAKVFLPGEEPAAYSAISLIGRGVYFLSWAAATVLFPAVARRHAHGGETGSLLRGGLIAVTVLGVCCAGGALLLGEPVLVLVLGPAYSGLAPQLAVYALVTTAFALANLIATTQLSTGQVRESWLMVAGAGALTVAVLIVHWSIDALIGAQLVVMVMMLAAVVVSRQRGKGVGMTVVMPYEAYNQWAKIQLEVKPRVSVVIPAYNEEIRILPTVGAIALHMSQRGEPWELIVADDGSKDTTVALLNRLGWANLRVLVAERNGGKGSAVRRGMLAAHGDFILFADADQSTPIEQFDTLLRYITDGGYDLAIGSRAATGAAVSNKSTLRKVLSAGLRGLVRIGFGLPIADTQCGFKLFTASAAHRLFDLQVIDSFSFDLEVLYLAERLGLRTAEVPVEWIDAPGSTVDAGKVSAQFVKELVKIRIHDLRGRYEVTRHPDPLEPPGLDEPESPANSDPKGE